MSLSSNFRRERKRKFDVKTLLNLRPASSAASSPSSPSAPTKTTPTAKKSTEESPATPTADLVIAKTKNEKRLSRRSDRQSKTEEKTPSTTSTTKAMASQQKSSVNQTPNDSAATKVEITDSVTPAATLTAATTPAATPEVVSGKRERKRKKFWDEQEQETPAAANSVSAKPAKKVGQVQQQVQKSSAPVKNRRRVSISGVAADSVENSFSQDNSKPTATTTAVTESNPAKENGKLKYLMFDLTSDPRLIAEKMIEGVNIPGPGVPIPIDSSKLPNGWEKRVIQRGIGITKGKWDVFIQNANGRSFR